MKILWLCNVVLPQIAIANNKSVNSFGGWLTDMSERLSNTEDVKFFVCFPYASSEKLRGKLKGMEYCSVSAFDADKCSDKNIEEFFEILSEFKPDIVHIFGTEFAHTLAMVKACQKFGIDDSVIVSIQGLVSMYARHYTAFLPYDIAYGKTVRDFIRCSSVIKQAKNYSARGKNEIAALKSVKHVIGRTDWDEACVRQINKDVTYHFCNETLRKSFYDNKWSLEQCERHSIFVSQSNYVIKGFHLMLEAFVEIKKVYPDAKLYTTGANIIAPNFVNKIKENKYRRYLRKFVEKNRLNDSVFFLGTLSEEEMCNRYLKSHIFVSCSSIENSPNSVGEAMILGVPTISSDVGGVKNMLVHGEDGFVYPADEPYMIAYYAKKIFDDDNLAKFFSSNAAKHAAITHDGASNFDNLMNIYSIVFKQ